MQATQYQSEIQKIEARYFGEGCRNPAWEKRFINYTEQDIKDFIEKYGDINLGLELYPQIGSGKQEVREVVFDIDRNNLKKAYLDAVIVWFFLRKLGISKKTIKVFFSGAKGFHVSIPPQIFGGIKGNSPNLLLKNFAKRIQEETGIELDMAVYSSSRIFRLPNTRHAKTGLYKRLLSSFPKLVKIDEILELAKEPGNEGYIIDFGHIEPSQKAIKYLQEAQQQKKHEKKHINNVIRLNNVNTEKFPSCIKNLLKSGVKEGYRNTTAFFITLFLRNQTDLTEEKIKNTLWGFKDTCDKLEHHDTFDEREIDYIINSIKTHNYKGFSCYFMRETTKCDCENCPFVKKGMAIDREKLRKLYQEKVNGKKFKNFIENIVYEAETNYIYLTYQQINELINLGPEIRLLLYLIDKAFYANKQEQRHKNYVVPQIEHKTIQEDLNIKDRTYRNYKNILIKKGLLKETKKNKTKSLFTIFPSKNAVKFDVKNLRKPWE